MFAYGVTTGVTDFLASEFSLLTMSEESEESVPLLPLQQESMASALFNTDQVGYECTLFF